MSLVLVQGAARNPNAADQQQKLKQAAEDLRSATNAAASDALKKKLVKRLEVIIMKKIPDFSWKMNEKIGMERILASMICIKNSVFFIIVSVGLLDKDPP